MTKLQISRNFGLRSLGICSAAIAALPRGMGLAPAHVPVG